MAQAKAITANPTVKAVLEYLNTKSSSSVPTGAICFFATTAIPTGWLLCNGSNVSRTEYAALFAAIGTKFGAGDGKTTFTLPNLDERFIEGTTDTAKVGQYLEAGLPNITGKVSDFNDRSIGINPSGAFYESGTTWARPGEWGGSDATRYSISMDASKSNVLYGKSNEVQPPAAWLLVCIKI